MRYEFISFVITGLLLSGSAGIGQIPALATDISPILVGEIIPDINLTDHEGDSVSFYSILEGRKTIIVFYRGNWCPRCIRYLASEFAPNLSTIVQLGYQFLAICPDTPAYLMKTSTDSGLDLKCLLSDLNGNLIRSMGLGYKADTYSKYIDQTSEGTNADHIISATAVYIIGPDYKVIFNFITPGAVNSEERMQWDLLYPVLKAL